MKIEIKNVCKRFGDVSALNHLSLELSNGIYGILGPNGAGKSTLINILTDNLKQDSGEILVDKADIRQLGKEYRKMIGYMPQQQVCYGGFTAQYFLEYMAVLKGMSLKDEAARRQIEFLLKRVNLYEQRGKKIEGFSGGMKRRIILAQALLGNPQIIILDEPTAGLDPKERISLRNMIAEFAREKIVLLATHIVSDIECIADYVILIKEGRVLCSQTVNELLDQVQDKVREIECSDMDLFEIQKQYPCSNIYQGKKGFLLHTIEENAQQQKRETAVNVNLEDVYLYFFESGLYNR